MTEGSIESRLVPIELLDAHPGQPKGRTKDVAELAESIGIIGVINPVAVLANGDRFTIVAGHRRTAAAKKAGLTQIECRVFPEGTPQWAIKAALAENLQRRDLTPIEEAAGIQTALKMGVGAEAIGKATGRTVDAEAIKRVTKQAKGLGADLAERRVTLEEAAAIAEFADLPKDQGYRYHQLVSAAGTPSFAHELQRHRDGLARHRAEQEAIASFKASGYEVVNDWGVPRGWIRIASIEVDGKKLTPANHKRCEGRAVRVYCGEVEHYCCKPELHGVKLSAGAQKTEKELEDDRRKRANRKAHKSATTVRHEHLTALCSGVLAAHLVTDRPGRVLNVDKANDIAVEFAAAEAVDHGLPQLASAYDAASRTATAFTCDGSTPVQKLLALAAGNVEKYLADSLKYNGLVAPAKSDRERYQRYFGTLRRFGYTLADCERELIGEEDPAPKVPTAPQEDIRVEAAEPADDEPEAIEQID
jgi:ParB-like chromosome segregation protein Spo0J